MRMNLSGDHMKRTPLEIGALAIMAKRLQQDWIYCYHCGTKLRESNINEKRKITF